MSRGGPVCPEAGLSVPGGPVYPEAGLSVPRRAYLSPPGPVCPEAGLSVPRRSYIVGAPVGVERGGRVGPHERRLIREGC